MTSYAPSHTPATVPAAWGHNRHIHVVGYRCVGHIAVAGRAAAAAAAAGRIAAGRIAAVDICRTPVVSVCVRVNTRIMKKHANPDTHIRLREHGASTWASMHFNAHVHAYMCICQVAYPCCCCGAC